MAPSEPPARAETQLDAPAQDTLPEVELTLPPAEDVEAPPQLGDTVHCIFCLEDASEDELLKLSPCACSGTLTSIHKHCLNKDIEHNLRLECPICRYPYHYKAKLAMQGCLGRWRRWLSVRRNGYLWLVLLPLSLALMAIGLALDANLVPGYWTPFAYTGAAILGLLFLYSSVLVNELPVRMIQVTLFSPTRAQLTSFEADKEAHTRSMRARGAEDLLYEMNAGERCADGAARNEEVLVLDFPITLQMMADREMPPQLYTLIMRSNEAAKLAAAQGAEEARRAAVASLEEGALAAAREQSAEEARAAAAGGRAGGRPAGEAGGAAAAR